MTIVKKTIVQETPLSFLIIFTMQRAVDNCCVNLC